MASNSQMNGQVVAYLALNGSKAFFAGLDQMPADFESLSEKDQEKTLKKCKVEGDKRKAAWNKKQSELAKTGKAQYLTLTVNGVKQRGELDWNSAETGLVARVLCGVSTSINIDDKKVTKSTPSRHLAASLGL